MKFGTDMGESGLKFVNCFHSLHNLSMLLTIILYTGATENVVNRLTLSSIYILVVCLC